MIGIRITNKRTAKPPITCIAESDDSLPAGPLAANTCDCVKMNASTVATKYPAILDKFFILILFSFIYTESYPKYGKRPTNIASG